MEVVAQVVLFTVVAGLKYPWATVAIGAVYVVARAVYAMGYVRNPKMRFFGLIPSNICLVTLFVMSVVSVL